LEKTAGEPQGGDEDLIAKLVAMSEGAPAPAAAQPKPKPKAEPPLVVQTLERELRPGEVSLDDLERAFRETEVEIVAVDVEPVAAPAPAPVPAPVAAKKEEPVADDARDEKPRRVHIRREEDQREETAKA